MTPLRHPTPCPACGRILSLNGEPCRCHGCGESIAPQLAAEALLINAGWVRNHMSDWRLPGVSDLRAMTGDTLVMFRHGDGKRLFFRVTDLPAIRAALDSLTPRQEVR